MSGIADAFGDAREHLRRHEMVVAVHPETVTDELRLMVDATPLASLRVSRFVDPGKLFIIHPGLLDDLDTGDSGATEKGLTP